MAGDDPQRRALLADLTRRLELASQGELRILERALQAIEQARGPRGQLEGQLEGPLSMALFDVALDIAMEDRLKDGRREAGADILGEVEHVGIPGDRWGGTIVVDEFSLDQQLTRVGGPEPYEVEIEEQDDLAAEWDVSDVGGEA